MRHAKTPAVPEKLTAAEVWNSLHFHPEGVAPSGSALTLRQAACQVIARLPRNVQEWVLTESDHLFVAGSDQLSELIRSRFHIRVEHPPGATNSIAEVNLRIIFLSESLADVPQKVVDFAIAQEIARSYVGGDNAEAKANRLVAEWGFTLPKVKGLNQSRSLKAKPTSKAGKK
jgi:hypothetical protein